MFVRTPWSTFHAERPAAVHVLEEQHNILQKKNNTKFSWRVCPGQQGAVLVQLARSPTQLVL